MYIINIMIWVLDRIVVERAALLKTAVPEFQSSALIGLNIRDIFFSPNGDRTGTAVLSSAERASQFEN